MCYNVFVAGALPWTPLEGEGERENELRVKVRRRGEGKRGDGNVKPTNKNSGYGLANNQRESIHISVYHALKQN